MLRNYLKIAFRNLLKYRGYSFINISGLAIGIACCALILLYVQKEISYDDYHNDVDQLYRVVMRNEGVANDFGIARISYPAAEVLAQEYPEIQAAARIYQDRAGALIKIEDQTFMEERFFFVDAGLPDILTIPFLKGNPGTALAQPHSVVLTEDIARKYFGSIDVLGKQFTVILNNMEVEYKVTGVAQNPPERTHFKYGLLVPLEDFRSLSSQSTVDFIINWYSYRFWTYIKLPEGYDPAALEAKLTQVVEKYFPPSRQHIRLFLQPVSDIHLISHLTNELETNNDIVYIYIFSAIALLVLIIACINFMNLTTARSINRAKEVGMRKVYGAQRTQLVRQFLAESVMVSLLAVIFAMGILEVLILVFNQLSVLSLEFNYFENLASLAGFVIIAITVGLFSGIYPAFFMSSFKPIKTLKGIFERSGGAGLRKVLVVLQIGITVVLLAGIMNINQQLTFIQNKKLGFSKEQVLVLYARGTAVAANERYDSFKQRLLQQPDIAGVTRNSHLIGTGLPIRAIFANPNAENSEKEIISSVFASYDFAAVHNLEIVDGRDFSKEFSSDVNGRAYILNQSAIKLLELEDPVGREISTGDRNRFDGEIVGVVKDFHFASLHEEISPLVINFVDAPFLPYICIKLGSSDYANTISRIEALWKQFEPDRHMEYYFLDDQLNRQYRFETQLGSIISYFTILAILIACLGLFGMASFTTERRTKEIGVRKTLGASVPGLVMLLSKDFARLVAFAFLMAAPIAYFVIDAWLQNFAYRTEIGVGTFIFTGILALLIALGTVSYQTIKAAMTNPVEALRYE